MVLGLFDTGQFSPRQSNTWQFGTGLFNTKSTEKFGSDLNKQFGRNPAGQFSSGLFGTYSTEKFNTRLFSTGQFGTGQFNSNSTGKFGTGQFGTKTVRF